MTHPLLGDPAVSVPRRDALSDAHRHAEWVHEHTWRLQAVICEDGVTAAEFTCIECDDVIFR
jgi:hypothetical protein